MYRLIKNKFSTLKLSRDTNQALGIGEYAIEFMKSGLPSKDVLHRTKLFHTDSVICGISALAQRTNAPTILKQDAIENYAVKSRNKSVHSGASCFGSSQLVQVEKAICANSSAVREWDSNGTVFGYRKEIEGCQAGEFGHNDYYPVIIACAQQNKSINGQQALLAMVMNDEIRGRLAEVFSLKTYKIDHVVHGAIASAATYGALMGATAQQIEHAIGMFIAHYIPFRAIRAGKQLSDSKGASAALSTEAAIISMKRAMQGFIGPKDIFRNPEAIFRWFQKTNGESPFDIYLGQGGSDFSIMGMHFKLGLYEHQSAGAIEGVLKLLSSTDLAHQSIDNIKQIKVISYEPAFGIIGDPAKRNPTTRQSADHSMVYIISRIIKKAMDNPKFFKKQSANLDEVWKKMILLPQDFGHEALHCSVTRQIMEKIQFEHGGNEYDAKYPDGIPTRVTVQLEKKSVTVLDSGFIMYPSGHARNNTCDLESILDNKFNLLGKQALTPAALTSKLNQLKNLENLSNDDLQKLYNCNIIYATKSIDE